jgi:predicted transposase/invertase (TIGR01784 family)
MTTAMNKGIAKGREEGRAEGITEGRADVARNLKKKGMSISDIADVTGLTEEEIKAL